MANAPEVGDELIAERRTGAPGELPPDMAPWMARTITLIDAFSLWVGRVVCWFPVPLFTIMVYEIFMRYAFIAPTMWAYDMSRFLYGSLFVLGAGYALSRGVHIRADFIYRTLSIKAQGWIDTVLYLVFYFPGLIVFFWASVDFSQAAWLRGERGMDTAWMPYVAPVKSALPIGILFLLIQGVSEVLKSIYAARRGRWPQV